MEKNNKNEEFDKLMEKYNFDSPIKVTLVIEEEDPPDLFASKNLVVPNNTNIPNTNVFSNNTEVYTKPVLNIDNFRNKISNGKQNCSSASVIEENNHSIAVNETILPEVLQEKSQDITLHLLETVADNLIHITKCFYYNFIHLKNQTDNEKLNSEYLTYKHHFFNLSYSTTVAILLPQEHNKHFFNKFIHKVIKIAHHSSWYQISYGKLESLIRDLLIWTKQKKKYLDMKLGSHNHDSNGINGSSTKRTNCQNFNSLKQILNRPFNSAINHLTQENNHPDVVPTTHLPVKVMNFSPNITDRNNSLTQDMTSPQNINPRTTFRIQDIADSAINSYIINNTAYKENTSHDISGISSKGVQRANYSNQIISNQFNLEYTANSSTEATKRLYEMDSRISAYEKTTNLNISSNNVHRTKNSMGRISHLPYTGSRLNHSTETITSLYNNTPKIYNQEIKANLNNILLSTGPPNRKIIISVDPEILASVNQNTKQSNNNSTEGDVEESYLTNTNKRQKTNDSYYQHCNSNSTPQPDKSNYHYQNNNSPAATLRSRGGRQDGLNHDHSRNAEFELYNTDILRSSISRDSGFCSPIYGSCRNEEMIEIPGEEQQTPIISHVTSMNPAAGFLGYGFCTVCGVTTNKMCIGCYQKYYCSSLCQNKDWDIHKYSCG